MNDFLKQLRSGGGKRFDRTRRPYDGNPQYRNPERQNGRDRKSGAHRKSYDSGQLQAIKRVLETLADGQKTLMDLTRRRASAEERIADALEALSDRLSRKKPNHAIANPETADAPAPAAPSPVSEMSGDGDAKTGKTVREKAIKIIADMHSNGARFEEIARQLTKMHVPTLSGKGQWRTQAVSRLFNQYASALDGKHPIE